MSPMKCNPLNWLWGLLPITILSLLAGLSIKDQVERDLTNRVMDDLKSSHSWAKVQFDGRDGLLSGQANDETEPGRAIQIASNIAGVRIFDGKADLLRKVEPYTWSAAHNGAKLVLTGFVPSEPARKQVLAAAKSSFPKAEIDDKLELARGNPLLPDWLEGVRFGLKELSALKTGKAGLSDLRVSLAGEAGTAAVYKDVQTALGAGLPKMLKLGTTNVLAPSVSPYTWTAKLAANQVVMTGYVPSERVRDDLVVRARKAFGKTTVVDRMEPGSGAPEDFEKAALVSIDQLATLQEGSAELKGADLSISGIAADDAIADATRKTFKAEAPKSLKIAEAIKAAKPVASPYVTKIDASANAVDLTGYVPSETERGALIAAVKTKFGGRAVNDKLQIAGGEPAGFDTCLMSAVAGLGRLGAGQISLADKKIELTGQTEDEALAVALPSEVRAAAKGVCETKVAIAYDDSKKRRAADDAATRAKLETEAAEKARRESDASDKAKRQAEQAADDAKRLSAAAATEQSKKEAASACEGDLRNAANSGTVQFQRASDVLLRDSLPTVRALAAVARKCTNVLIEIEGHTDSEGIPERNQPLSERRAQSVVDFLVENGVDTSRIKAIGYGDTRPVAPNDTAENRAKNRRIAFTVKSQ
jgi:OmpA-OmpF porin, OOP family